MRIICVVVTFNRKQLLKKCIDSLLSQSLKIDRILVVDNASTDGTVGFIKEYYHNFEQIEILKLTTNLGGAGGFHEGMKYASELDYDWLWLMDDDGYPETECLNKIYNFSFRKTLDAISPIQLNINEPNELAFPVTYHGQQIIGDYQQLSHVEYINQEANLFNGLLIRKNVVEKIGLPISDLFIRGDEVEYTKRMKKNKLSFGTLVDAKFFHPSDKNERIKVLFNLWTMRDAHSDFKNYYMFRNRAVAFIEDGNAWLLPLDLIRYTYYFLIVKKLNIKGLKLWCLATIDGIKGKLGRHSKY
jgi:rhamnopyranosyl-N-acetylglucosaminyl-diphospho-decaprenol beta-1,3/1,4-galactofuranosyltransferase